MEAGFSDVVALSHPAHTPRITSGHLLRSGRHLALPGVSSQHIRQQIAVRAAPPSGGGATAAGDGPGGDAGASLVWEVDGEPAGVGPAVVTVVPAALRLCV